MGEVPADRVGREFSTLYRDLQKRVKIPGFRPGKVPRRILENQYRHSVEQEVLQNLVPSVLTEAMTQEGISPIGQRFPLILHQGSTGQSSSAVTHFTSNSRTAFEAVPA